jgi:hypothetical protein
MPPLSCSCSAQALAGEGDGEDYDLAAHDLLLAELQTHEGEAVVDEADQERAEHRAQDRTVAAGKRLVPSRITAAITESSSPSPHW